MNIPLIIAGIVCFVLCLVLKMVLHIFSFPLVIPIALTGFILLMVGLFKSSFTNVQLSVPEEEKKNK